MNLDHTVKTMASDHTVIKMTLDSLVAKITLNIIVEFYTIVACFPLGCSDDDIARDVA
jgi:hypothetical protein